MIEQKHMTLTKWTWCPVCMDRTNHTWTSGSEFVCDCCKHTIGEPDPEKVAREERRKEKSK